MSVIDDNLKQAVEIASVRGSRYVKGDVSIEELPSKVAELGIYLLEKSKALGNLRGENLREELTDMQGKIDDMRKTLFNCKASTFSAPR